MANLGSFDASEFESRRDFEPIPAGKYVAVITASEMKPTRSGNGAYLELRFQIIDGEFKGRMLWARLNIENPNPTVVKIARCDLADICRAVGVMRPRDSVELHNLPLVITVVNRIDQDGRVKAEIKKYEGRDSVNGANQAQNATPPWRRGW